MRTIDRFSSAQVGKKRRQDVHSCIRPQLPADIERFDPVERRIKRTRTFGSAGVGARLVGFGCAASGVLLGTRSGRHDDDCSGLLGVKTCNHVESEGSMAIWRLKGWYVSCTVRLTVGRQVC